MVHHKWALLQLGKVSFFAERIFDLRAEITALGIGMFTISPGKSPYKVAVFIPEKGATLGTILVFKYPRVDKPTCLRRFLQIRWMFPGISAMIFTVNQEVDRPENLITEKRDYFAFKYLTEISKRE